MKVNGSEMNFKNINNIIELLDKLKVNKDRVVIELNGVIVSKEDFGNVNLNEDDTIEVISFVGGG
ncbi:MULTISPECIES: sulfur carrier protein ThiS [unclassified Clostridium]|uniref:sulfur carrier protein ThiS n=1 Tax=unclassified Clostridium TaxID=2614128 RepID=UPI0025FDEAC8|nr:MULTISPECIES: sulfur carrier protein ThiS [unclassified Clostridium]MDU4327454.1 sulfur carrier protein ThiS [Clostridium celatum]MDY2640149.1 sulfur carrier protein ThiS [Ligilactobacillus salivarius]